MQYISTAMLMAMLACSSCKKEPPKPAPPPPHPAPAVKPPEAPNAFARTRRRRGSTRRRRKDRLWAGLESHPEGTGTAHPGAEDTVKVHYTGWMTTAKCLTARWCRGVSPRNSRSIT